MEAVLSFQAIKRRLSAIGLLLRSWVGCLHVPGCRANTLRQFELVDLDLIVARFQSVQHLSI
jgi:hypothetical protein